MQDKTFLVLGGTSGIGLEISKQLLALQAKVVAASKYEQEFDLLESDLKEKMTYIQVDITDRESRQQLVSKIQDIRFNGIISSVGILSFGPLVKTPSEQLEKVINTNYTGIVLLHAELLPKIMDKISPSEPFYLTYISSATVDRYIPYFGTYPSTRVATEAFFLSARDEFPKNFKVLAIRPSSVRTNLYNNAYVTPGADIKLLAKKTENTFSNPDKIARAVIAKMKRKKEGVIHPDLITGIETALLKMPIIGDLLTGYYLKKIREAAGS